MRPFVAVLAIPLRHLTGTHSEPDRSEDASEVEDRAAKLRQAKQRAEGGAQAQSVPDEGVACIGSEAQSVFAPAEDVAMVTEDSASLSGERWIKTELTIDVEGCN